MKAQEPALALDSIERRVPLDSFAHVGDGAHDERIETAPDVAFPPRHSGDIGPHGSGAVGLRDLRVAAYEECGLRAALGGDFICTWRGRSGHDGSLHSIEWFSHMVANAPAALASQIM